MAGRDGGGIAGRVGSGGAAVVGVGVLGIIGLVGTMGAAAGDGACGTGGGRTIGIWAARAAGSRWVSRRFKRASSDAIFSRASVHFRMSHAVAQSSRNSRKAVIC